MITVAESRPVQVEAMRFTGDNIVAMREFVGFTGHRFQIDNTPGAPAGKFYIDQRPGVILTVVKGEWVVYNLSDATWRVFSDKEFNRQFRTQS